MVRNLVSVLACLLLASSASPAAAQVLTEIGQFSGDGPLNVAVERTETRIAVSATYNAIWIHQSNGAGGYPLYAYVPAANPNSGDLFAWAFAMDGVRMAVGARSDDSQGLHTGAVYMYDEDPADFNWDPIQKLTASDAASQEAFGRSLDLEGDSLAVAAGSGIYFFDADPVTGLWSESAKVPLGDSTTHVREMDRHGDRLVAAAQHHVFVLEKSGGVWALAETISIPTYLLRWEIALAGDTLAVHARQLGSTNDTVHVYDRDPAGGWALSQVITDPTNASDTFGVSLSMEEGRLLVGSSYADQGETNAGAAYLYERDGSGVFALATVLSTTSPEVNGRLGHDVNLHGNEAVVVAAGTGLAYRYDLSGPVLEVTLDGPACTESSTELISVAVAGSNTIDTIEMRQNGAQSSYLCIDCGLDPVFDISRSLNACTNDFEVTATDSSGLEATDQLSVKYDDQAPVLNCPDRTIQIASDLTSIPYWQLSFPTAFDGCDGYVPTDCAPFLDYFPLGTTHITCNATDACGHPVSCEYDLTLVHPPEGCYVAALVDDVGGGLFGDWQQGPLGNGSGPYAQLSEDGLLIRGTGESLYHGSEDHGYFVYRTEDGSDDLRVEIDFPEVADYSPAEFQKGGLMLRHGMGASAARVMAMYLPATGGGIVQFDVRPTDGGVAQTLASSIPAVGVRGLALEKTGNRYEVFYTTNGTDWIRPGGALGGEAVLPAASEVLVGMAVSSSDVNESALFAFETYESCITGDSEPPPPSPASISGLVWWDQDADAHVDDAELVLSNVQVELRDGSFARLETTYTDAQGRYSFSNLDAGEYVVAIDSAIFIGGVPEPTYDLDGTDTAEYARVNLGSGQDLDADFGYRVASQGGMSSCQNDDFEDGVLDSEWFLTSFGDADQVQVAEAGGQLQLSGDGSSMYLGPDNGGYLFRDADGDFRVEVDIDAEGMVGAGSYAKAGLMVRPGLGSNEPRMFVQLIPYWNGTNEAVLQFRYRATEGGQSDAAWGSNVRFVPRSARIAIERQGDWFFVEYSFDGGNFWHRPAGGVQGALNLALPEVLLVGTNVVSYDTATATTALFDDFSLCPLP